MSNGDIDAVGDLLLHLLDEPLMILCSTLVFRSHSGHLHSVSPSKLFVQVQSHLLVDPITGYHFWCLDFDLDVLLFILVAFVIWRANEKQTVVLWFVLSDYFLEYLIYSDVRPVIFDEFASLIKRKHLGICFTYTLYQIAFDVSFLWWINIFKKLLVQSRLVTLIFQRTSAIAFFFDKDRPRYDAAFLLICFIGFDMLITHVFIKIW